MEVLRNVARWLAILALIGLGVRAFVRSDGGPAEGSVAPEFSAPVLGEAAPFQLSAHRGQTIVLDFWATWCPPCQRTLPALQILHERYRGSDVLVYGVNTDDADAARPQFVGDFLKRRKLAFPVILDNGGISRDYRVQAIPTLVVIRPDGRVEEAHVGLLDDDPSAIALAVGEMIDAARTRKPEG